MEKGEIVKEVPFFYLYISLYNVVFIHEFDSLTGIYYTYNPC